MTHFTEKHKGKTPGHLPNPNRRRKIDPEPQKASITKDAIPSPQQPPAPTFEQSHTHIDAVNEASLEETVRGMDGNEFYDGNNTGAEMDNGVYNDSVDLGFNGEEIETEQENQEEDDESVNYGSEAEGLENVSNPEDTINLSDVFGADFADDWVPKNAIRTYSLDEYLQSQMSVTID